MSFLDEIVKLLKFSIKMKKLFFAMAVFASMMMASCSSCTEKNPTPVGPTEDDSIEVVTDSSVVTDSTEVVETVDSVEPVETADSTEQPQ